MLFHTIKPRSHQDAFGMLMPSRTYQASGVDRYRFGFNGKERDDEVNGDGNSVAFKYRIHDPRLGKFLSVDPLEKEYPWNSTYAFAENQVIWAMDLEGAESMVVIHNKDDKKTTTLTFSSGGKLGDGLLTIVESHKGVHSITYTPPVTVGPGANNSQQVGPRRAYLSQLSVAMRFEIYKHQHTPNALGLADELKSIPIKLTKPIWNNIGLEAKTTVTLGYGKADVYRAFGFGKGEKSFVGVDVAEYDMIDGLMAMKDGKVPVSSLDVPLNLKYSFQEAWGAYSGKGEVSFSPQNNGTLDISLSGNAYGLGLKATAYRATGALPGGAEAKGEFFPSESINGTSYSILDISKDISTGKGYEAMYNTTIDVKLNLKGFLKDVKEQYNFND